MTWINKLDRLLKQKNVVLVCEFVKLSQQLFIFVFRFFCRQYAMSATPSQGSDADICPEGFFCPEGTAEPEQCLPGSFSDTVGLYSAEMCNNCTAGKLYIFYKYISFVIRKLRPTFSYIVFDIKLILSCFPFKVTTVRTMV